MLQNAIIIFLLLLSTVSFAQDGKAAIAIKFGLSHSSIREKGNPDNPSIALIPVPTTGFTYISPIKNNLYLQAELLYTQKGDVYEFPSGINQEKARTRVKLNVIEIPLLIRVQSKKGKKAIPYFNGGLSLGFVVGKSAIITQQPVSNYSDFRRSIQKDVSIPFDPGLVAGAGIKLQEAIMFELRYSRGFINIFPGPSKPQVISFSTLFRFR